MVRFALKFYLPLAFLAYVILLWRHGWDVFRPAPGWLFFSAVAFGVALLVVLLSHVMGQRYRWAQEMETEFMKLLGPLTLPEVVILAAVSGVSEEVCFRGVLQPWLGLLFTSLLFGAVHVPYSRKLLPWTVFAFVMGLVLGLLYELSGSLIPPMVAHAAVNGINLKALADKARRLGIPRPSFEHRFEPDDPFS